jgi:hypothetical protein
MSIFCAKFRATVFGPHINKAWAERLFETLQFVTEHPECCLEIGLIPSGPRSFLVNSDVFAGFLGLKRNSLNHNFQQHGFGVDATSDVCQEALAHTPELALCARHWSKRTFKYGPFNPQCTPEQVAFVADHAKHVRRRITPAEEDLPPLQDLQANDVENVDDWWDIPFESGSAYGS